MTETKFTPGPWGHSRALKTVDGEYDWAIGAVPTKGGEVRCIAECFGRVSNSERPNAEANARLIAAAPDLLAAVVRLLDCSDDPDEQINAQRIALAAFAKATGGFR